MVVRLHEKDKSDQIDLKRWMKNPPGDLVALSITPELAAEMLNYNVGNRPISNSTVERYSNMMKSGDWKLTYEPIIFSDALTLRDGQHRLQACVTSGMTFPARVAFGDKDENFAFINMGKKRGGSDVFAIHGVKNHALMAGATRWIWAYEDHKMSGHNAALYPEAFQLYERYLTYPRLPDSTHFGWMFAKEKLAPPSPMTAMHYLCAQKSRKLADRFFDNLASGLNFSGSTDPAYRLRSRLIKNSQAEERLRALNICALTILAWNAARLGRTPRTFRWNVGEKFPRIQ